MESRRLLSTAVFMMAGIMGMVVVGCGDRETANTVANEKPDNTKAVVKPAADDTNVVENSDGEFSPYVDKDGEISLPKDYKQKWTHLGSWAVARKEGETVHEMHDVYTQPETTAAYNKTGEFPDGTVLVKEVRHTKTDELTTGHASWSTDIKIWFVMIKDQKERFKDSDHWGEGWGWALFEAKDPTKNVSAGYDSSCISCHVPVEDTDWVYTYGYPTLKPPKQE
jgi:hypothetical protein